MPSYSDSILTYDQAKLSNAELVSDYFEDGFGQWLNYATTDPNQSADLINQQHTDIRSFYPLSTTDGYISDLFTKTMSTLSSVAVGSISALTGITKQAESWVLSNPYTTNVTNVAVSGNVATLTLDANNGIEVNDQVVISGISQYPEFNGTFTVTASVTSSPYTISYNLTRDDLSVVTLSSSGLATLSPIGSANSWRALKIRSTSVSCTAISEVGSIDISAYGTGSFVSLAFPNFPSAMTLADCSVEFTSDPVAEGFATGKTDKILFSSSALLDNGTVNREFKIPIASLPNVMNSTNKGIITGIRFTLKSSSSVWFYCSGIRCVDATWKYAPLDINTIDNAVMKSVPPTGAIPTTTLATAITITGALSSVVLTDSSQFPTSGTILLESEYITYTTNNGTGTLGGTITRGALGSTAATHTSTTPVTSYQTKFSINDSVSLLPKDWPALFRSYNTNALPTDSDPKFLDGSVYSVIDLGKFVGSNTSATNVNSFTFYFRNDGRLINQQELNAKTQADLSGNKIENLVFGSTSYTQKQQKDLSFITGTKASNLLPGSTTNTYQDNPLSLVHSDGLTQSTLSQVPGNKYTNVFRFGSFANTPAKLASAITDTQTTSVTVTNPSSLAASGTLLIENELITYTSISSGVLGGVVRGAGSTTAIAHRQDNYVLQYVADHGYQIGWESAGTLTGYKQSDFVKTVDPNNFTYVATSLQWYQSGSDIKFKMLIQDELAPLFSFNITNALTYWKNKTVVFKTSLIDNQIRCELFELKNDQLYLIYDTKMILSDFFHRIQGKFGWTADLKDGGTRINSIRSGGVVYGEYKSKSMKSFTPVRGAQIYANQTKDVELVTDLGSNRWSTNTGSVTFEEDNTDSKNPVIVYSVSNNGVNIWQGVQTNKFKIENFEDFYATFDVNIPESGSDLVCLLYNEDTNKFLDLNVPIFNKNQWDSVKIIANNDKFLPGYYRLVIAQKDSSSQVLWNIKNVSIKQRVINWDLRSYVNESNQNDNNDWVRDYFINVTPSNDFTKTTNKNDGVVFAKSGSSLQARAQAVNPYVEIHNFEIHPDYATLGNFKWRDN